MRALRPVRRAGPGVVIALAAAIALASCSSPPSAPVHSGDPIIAAAGDVACDPSASGYDGGRGTTSSCHEKATSDLLVAGNYTAVLPLGDVQYECGKAADFQQSYARTWGRVRDITRPVIGNHEYGHGCHVDDPSGYFGYFGKAAGPLTGYYSFEVGSWHIVVLNSECSSGRGQYTVGGCNTGSPQETWLRHDLAAHPTRCTLAAWHEPRFSSGEHGDAQSMADIWNDLVAAHADVVLSGHNHDYERFDPIGRTPGIAVPRASDPKAQPNFQAPVASPTGIREFVVGTGGKNHYRFVSVPLPGERVRNKDTFGILALTLRPRSYDWTFVPEPGHAFHDSGSAACH